MKQTITKSMFRDAFHNMGRGDQFSYDGLSELYDHLEASDENYELDVIELCCDFAEGDIDEVLKSYNLNTTDELHDKTFVVWLDNSTNTILYAQF